MYRSLTKDMTGKEDVYRAAAVRALCKITDVMISGTNKTEMKNKIFKL